MSAIAEQAAILLAAARMPGGAKLADLPAALRPADRDAAYAIQRCVSADPARIGGWKVGAAGPDAPPQCAPMPKAGVLASPARLDAATHVLRGIEAEVAFLIGHDLPPRPRPYDRAAVIAAIASAHPAIEVLEAAYADPDAVDPLTNLADAQVHGGFVHGAGVSDWQGIDFGAETVTQSVDGAAPMTRTGNPAGDMIRLVLWLANEGSVWAGGLKAGQFVTCGSWTGKSLVGATATVRVAFPSLGEAVVSYGS